MAGTLVISTLSDGTNSTSATNCIQGSAKAWVNFNGSGGATVRASYNVSSVTRAATGDYTINFTNALADANYVLSGSMWTGTNDAITANPSYKTTTPFTTSSARIMTTASTGTVSGNDDVDATIVCCAFFR